MATDGYGFEQEAPPASGGATTGVGVGALYVTKKDSADAQQKANRRREKELISVGARLLIAPGETAAQRRKYHQNDNLSTSEHVLACIFTATFGKLHASGMDIFSTHTRARPGMALAVALEHNEKIKGDKPPASFDINMADLIKQDLQVEIIPGNIVQTAIEAMDKFHGDMRNWIGKPGLAPIMDGLKREPTSGPFGGQVHTTDEAPPPEDMAPVKHPSKLSSADGHDGEKEDNDEHHMDEEEDPWTTKTTDHFAFPGMDTDIGSDAAGDTVTTDTNIVHGLSRVMLMQRQQAPDVRKAHEKGLAFSPAVLTLALDQDGALLKIINSGVNELEVITGEYARDRYRCAFMQKCVNAHSKAPTPKSHILIQSMQIGKLHNMDARYTHVQDFCNAVATALLKKVTDLIGKHMMHVTDTSKFTTTSNEHDVTVDHFVSQARRLKTSFGVVREMDIMSSYVLTTIKEWLKLLTNTISGWKHGGRHLTSIYDLIRHDAAESIPDTWEQTTYHAAIRVQESKQKLRLFASTVTGLVATESRQVQELKARIDAIEGIQRRNKRASTSMAGGAGRNELGDRGLVCADRQCPSTGVGVPHVQPRTRNAELSKADEKQ